jgi:hypothetical protein
MIKKILQILGFMALAAILVAGGIIRTRAVTGATGLTDNASETNPEVTSVPAVDALDRVTLEGVVQNQDSESFSILSDSGEIILIGGRSQRYLDENSFQISVGERIRLTGFYENGTFEVASITNPASGKTLMLRGEDGRPMWAGGGR